MNRHIGNQYSTGLSRHNIEQALIATGKYLSHLEPADLGILEDFHTLGRIATSQLADLAQISRQDRVLDAGSGIGGTSRFLAHRYGCAVTALDLTEERFGLDTEVTAPLLRNGVRPFEVPVSYYSRSRAQGKKIKTRDALVCAWVLLKVRLRRLRTPAPLHHEPAPELGGPARPAPLRVVTITGGADEASAGKAG